MNPERTRLAEEANPVADSEEAAPSNTTLPPRSRSQSASPCLLESGRRNEGARRCALTRSGRCGCRPETPKCGKMSEGESAKVPFSSHVNILKASHYRNHARRACFLVPFGILGRRGGGLAIKGCITVSYNHLCHNCIAAAAAVAGPAPLPMP
jgi:hypothetical protein